MSGSAHFPELVLRAARQHIPLDISLELTNRCNHRCAHCYIPDFDVRDGLSTERIFRLLEELAEMGTLFLILTGGEPLLRRDWGTIARRARELGFQVMLLSNGALIDEGAADLMAELNLQVRISFHAAGPETFDRVTAQPGSFQRVLAALRRLLERDADVELTIPVTALNREAATSVPAMARELGVPCRLYSELVPAKDGVLAPLQLRLPEEEAVLFLDIPPTACELPAEAQARIHRDLPPCAAGVRYAAISASGEVRACTVLPQPAGNLNKQSFREIWEGSSWFRKLRNITAGDLDTCSSCNKLAYCGRCHALALLEDGNLLGPSRQACSRARAIERLQIRGA